LRKFKLINVILSLIVLVVFAQTCYPQRQDSLYNLLTKERQFEWLDIYKNGKGLIADYYDKGMADSADIIIKYIERKYNVGEFKDFKLLRLIEKGQYTDAPCDTAMMKAIIFGYLSFNSMDGYSPNPDSNGIYYSRNFLNWGFDIDVGKYNQVIIEMADSLRQVTRPYSSEHAICQAICGDYNSIRSDLLNGRYANSCLGKCYLSLLGNIERELQRDRANYALSAGGCITGGQAKIFKHSPYFDFLIGRKGEKYGADFGFGMNNGKAKTDFPTKLGKGLDTLKTQITMHLYLGLNNQVLQTRRLATDLLLGFDFGLINIVETPHDKIILHMNSETVYFGIRQKYYYNHSLSYYVGLEAKAGLMRLGSKRGDLSGNIMTVCLIWGFTGNSFEIGQAKELGYYDRDRKSSR
jgi:hypothetical protein